MWSHLVKGRQEEPLRRVSEDDGHNGRRWPRQEGGRNNRYEQRRIEQFPLHVRFDCQTPKKSEPREDDCESEPADALIAKPSFVGDRFGTLLTSPPEVRHSEYTPERSGDAARSIRHASPQE